MSSQSEFADAMDVDEDFHPTPVANFKGSAPMTFKGTTDIMKLPNFITVMKVQFLTRHIATGDDKVAYFGRNLAGPAAEWFFKWFESHCNEPLNFEEFIDDFRGHFIQRLDPQKIMNAMPGLKQNSKGIEHYNSKFRQLWSLMPADYWTEKGALLSYMRGLKPETASLVALTYPTTLESAYHAAYNTVAITNRYLDDMPKPTVDHEGDVIMTGAEVRGYDRSNQSNNRVRNNHGGNNGRLSREECFRRHLCFKCQRPGHNFRNCQSRGSNASNRY